MGKFILILVLTIPFIYLRAEGQTTNLRKNTAVEARIITFLNKKGGREKITALIAVPVRDSLEEILIEANAPVKIRTTRKKQKRGDKFLRIDFISVKAVDGQTVGLHGSVYKKSEVRNSRERRTNAITNLVVIPFGWIAPAGVEKKDIPD